MSSSNLAVGIRQLRRKMALHYRQEENDENLLHAFTSRRDESAFAVLVRRHGPMVLNVCRRVLGHEHDAEDAFQATFLVLAQSAATLRNKTMLTSFLQGTAYRTAMKAKQSAARRRKHEGSLGALTQPRSPADPADALSWREVRTLLDEEIARLPEIYRSVFVLCCLQGISRDEAARRLQVKEGTVSSRLAEARERLAKRLARRGVELTAVLAATAVATPSASALPAGLMAKTITAVMAMASGKELASVVSASVVELVQGATTALIGSKARITAVLLLFVATSGSLVDWFGRASGPLAATMEPPTAKAATKPRVVAPKPEAANTVAIQGRVLDPEGKPKAGAKILMHSENSEVKQLGVSAADGRFTVAVPKGTKNHWLVTKAEGCGIDFVFYSGPLKAANGVELRLGKDKPIRGRVVNTEGKPMRGVRVAVISILVYSSLDSFLSRRQEGKSYWEIAGFTKQIWPRASSLLTTTTDADGRFVLHGTGPEQSVSLRLRGGGIADALVNVVNRAGFDAPSYNRALRGNLRKGASAAFASMLHGPDGSLVVEAEKPIRGIVTDADTGKGRPGVLVHLSGNRGGPPLGMPYQTRTDAEGRYEMHGVHKAKSYRLEVEADPSAGYMPCQVWIDDTAGYLPIATDIRVKKGVTITGKVIDQATGRSVPGFAMVGFLAGNPYAESFPEFSSSGLRQLYYADTGEDGTFRIVAIPGPVLLMGGLNPRGGSRRLSERLKYQIAVSDPKYPQYFQKRSEISGAGYLRYKGGLGPLAGNFCKVLQIEPTAKVVKQDILLKRSHVQTVNIQDAEGHPLRGVWMKGISFEPWESALQIEKDICSVYHLEAGKPRLLVFYEPSKKLAGTIELRGDEKSPVVVKLGPTGLIRGRLLDVNGKPLAGVIVNVHYHQRPVEEVHNVARRARKIVSDAEGDFTFDAVIPGQKCELSFQREKRKFERASKPATPVIELKSGECRDVGAIELK